MAAAAALRCGREHYACTMATPFGQQNNVDKWFFIYDKHVWAALLCMKASLYR